MKKLITIFLILCLTTSAFAQFQQKPMLGEQVNRAHPLSDFVAAWFFLEGSGNKVFDLSGNGNDLTLYNSPSWVAGKFGSVTDYNGSSQYGEISAVKNPLAGLTATTVLLWFKSTDTEAALKRIIGNGAQDDFDIATNFSGGVLGEVSDNHLGWYIRETGGWYDVGAIILGKWTQIVVTADTIQLKAYINGVNTYTNATAWTNGVDDVLHLMADDGFGQYNLGSLDHAIIWNRVLSASEIADLYMKPFCMFEQDDVAIMEASIPAPTGGQVIIIQMSAIPILLIPALFFIKRRQRG